MHAVIRTSGKQFRVAKGDIVRLPLMDSEVGSSVEIADVLELSSGETPVIGTPVVAGAKVQVKVLRHGKEKKILVYKYKRRKGYEKRQGYRQDFTEVRVEDIVVQ